MIKKVVYLSILSGLIFFVCKPVWAYGFGVKASYAMASHVPLNELTSSLLAFRSAMAATAHEAVINHTAIYKKSVGDALEDTMHALYSQGKGGYKNISLPGHTGIDGLYIRGKGKNLKIIIAEGKFNKSQLGQKTKIGSQMSKRWTKNNFQKGIDDIDKNVKKLEGNDKLTPTEKKHLKILKNNHKFLSANKNKIIQMIDAGAYNRELVRGKIENGRLIIEVHGIDENLASNRTKTGNLKESSSHKKPAQLYDTTKDGKGRTLKFATLDKPGIALDSATYDKEYRKLYNKVKRAKIAKEKARSEGKIEQANKLKEEINHIESQRATMSQTRNNFIRSYSKNYGTNIENRLIKDGVSEKEARKLGKKYEAEIKKLIAKGNIKNPKDIQYLSSPDLKNLDLEANAKIYNVKIKTDTSVQRVYARSSIMKARYVRYGNELKTDVNKRGYLKVAGKRIHHFTRKMHLNIRRTGTKMRQGIRYFNARTTTKGKITGAKMVAKVAGRTAAKGVMLALIIYDGFETVKFVKSNHTHLEAYQFYAQKAGGLAGAYAGAWVGGETGGGLCAATVVLLEAAPVCAGVGAFIGGSFGYFTGNLIGGHIGNQAYAWMYAMNKAERLQYHSWLQEYYRTAAIAY